MLLETTSLELSFRIRKIIMEIGVHVIALTKDEESCGGGLEIENLSASSSSTQDSQTY